MVVNDSSYFAAIEQITRLYARPRRYGKFPDAPVRCSHQRKIIYPDIAAARAAADAMSNLGASPQRAYECPNSKHGHAHLTTKKAWTP